MLDGRLSAHVGIALMLANTRYWSSIAPLVREQVAHWGGRARAISDPQLRALALEKLDDEGFNAEVAATLATLAPRTHRRRVVKAIVALEILYDYLDGLTESPSSESPQDGACLFGAFTDAVCPAIERSGDYYRHHPQTDASGYMEELVSTVRFALAGLPAATKLAGIFQRTASRSGEAQLRIHSLSLTGIGPLRRWATEQAAGTSLEWREFLAGAASSVLGVHALIAAAANRRTTCAQASEIDRAYLAISVLPTVLDSLVDHESDVAAGKPGYVELYENREVLQRGLLRVIREAVELARRLPNGPHHVMTIVGIVAYYTSAPTARGAYASSVSKQAVSHLQPLIGPTLGVMYAWRSAKRLRGVAPSKAIPSRVSLPR